MSVNLWPQWFPMEARHLYYEASAMIIGLINLGHMLEARARQRSSKALEKLLDLTPPTARVVTEDGEKASRWRTFSRGCCCGSLPAIACRWMAKLPGEAWLDEAMLTGEPIPQQKAKATAFMPAPSSRRQRPVPRQRGGQSYHAVTHYSHGTPGAEQ